MSPATKTFSTAVACPTDAAQPLLVCARPKASRVSFSQPEKPLAMSSRSAGMRVLPSSSTSIFLPFHWVLAVTTPTSFPSLLHSM